MNAQPTPDEIERDLAFAIDAARRAGQRVMTLRAAGRWEDRQLADVGDQAADGYLQGLLLGRYPDDGVLSEETADSPDRLEKQRAWIVDPLDGTKEFCQLRDDWAVHVALTRDNRCSIGAVALPMIDKVMWGVVDGANTRAGIEGGGELLPGDSDSPSRPRVVVSRSHTPDWMQRFVDAVDGETLPTGSVGFKVGRLLQGEADLYVHKIGLKEWDTCAPETVARAMGWTVCKLRGDEHRYNQRDPKNHEFVVCRPAWRERVLEALAGCGALDD